MKKHEETLVIEDAAEFLNVSKETLRRKAQSGEVPASKPGKGWIFIKEDLIKYLRSLYHGESIVYALEKNPNEGVKWQLENDIAKRIQKNMCGGLISHRKVEKEYESLLALKTGQKHNNYTTN